MISINFRQTLPLLFSTFLLSSCATSRIDITKENVLNSNSNNILEHSNKINRIVTLTSLSTDIVDNLDSRKLVAIPGSSLFKAKTQFDNLPRISMGRTPPNIEKIVSLKPDLVIGTKGFHDKILSKLNDVNINTFSYEVRSWNDLEQLISTISSKLSLNPIEIVEYFRMDKWLTIKSSYSDPARCPSLHASIAWSLLPLISAH